MTDLHEAAELVTAFLPRFEAGEFAGAFETFMQTGNDLPAVDEFALTVARSGFQLVFDWGAWRGELTGDPFAPERVANADLETIRKLLTYAVRQDRFCDGFLSKHCADGSIERALQRLAEIMAADRSS